jgi:hypothetical protein
MGSAHSPSLSAAISPTEDPSYPRCSPRIPVQATWVGRGHYELGVGALPGLIVAAAFDELAPAV